jgi:predicted glycosyl hydrolase (DUF1957 family)
MAAINHHLEWKIKKAKEAISNLPNEERECVNYYIQHIRDILERSEERNKKADDFFRQLKYLLR